MSRTLDARLSKIEMEIGADGGEGQSYEDLLRAIRARLLEMIESPNTTPAECTDARAKLSHLDAEVWSFGHGEQKRLNIIDALREWRLTSRMCSRVVDERKGDSEGPDWDEVAAGLGLAPAVNGPPRLITHLIVYPDNMLTVNLTRLGNGVAVDEPIH